MLRDYYDTSRAAFCKQITFTLRVLTIVLLQSEAPGSICYARLPRRKGCVYFATQRRECHFADSCLLQIKRFLHDSVTKAQASVSNNSGAKQNPNPNFPATAAAIQGAEGLPFKIGHASGGGGRERDALLVSDGV